MNQIPRLPCRFGGAVAAALVLLGAAPAANDHPARAPLTMTYPVLFVTQVPIPQDFATIGSVFANHLATRQDAGRGGDLWIAYPDGTLRNLTAEAGFGGAGFQGQNAIAVRDPAVHWDGQRALFSMVRGAPTQQYQVLTFTWQIYQVSGLAQGQPVAITLVPAQPPNANNVSPIYDSSDRIVFVSDHPRGGAPHLYPLLDEYESTPTPSGLWRLDPESGALDLLDHAPSGDFDPLVDGFGRIVFTRWDHLQQDQQADADALAPAPIYGAFDWQDEGAGAAQLPRQDELFPEPRAARTDILPPHLEGHSINTFLPWQIRQDGRQLEVLNHLGRHELHSYFNRARNDDPNLREFIAATSGRTNPNSVDNLLHLAEDPATPGRFLATSAPEFGTHAAGQIVAIGAPLALNPDLVTVVHTTHPATRTTVADGATPPAGHSGHYRDPVVLFSGTVLAAHTTETHRVRNLGTRANPLPNYLFLIRRLEPDGGYLAAGSALTGGITKTLSYWDPDVLVQYSGALWELDPVEVKPLLRPTEPASALEPPEAAAFAAAAVDPAVFEAWLAQRSLALLSVRNATTRDRADRQQPFNLAVPGGVATIGMAGTVYDLDYLQLFSGDQVRGYSFHAGRRVLARPLSHPTALQLNPPSPGRPPGVPIYPDGSTAAFVPAARALTWQTLSPAGEPVVRERYWLTLRAGEVRVCDGCHGVNTTNQAGAARADQSPAALRALLERWRAPFADDFESADTSRWSSRLP